MRSRKVYAAPREMPSRSTSWRSYFPPSRPRSRPKPLGAACATICGPPFGSSKRLPSPLQHQLRGRGHSSAPRGPQAVVPPKTKSIINGSCRWPPTPSSRATTGRGAQSHGPARSKSQRGSRSARCGAARAGGGIVELHLPRVARLWHDSCTSSLSRMKALLAFRVPAVEALLYHAPPAP